MPGTALYAELAAVRTMVADGLSGIGEAGDTGRIRMRSVSARLAAFDSAVTEAAGVLTAPVRVLAVTLVTFPVAAGAATLAAAAGLGAAGVLLLAATVLLAVLAVSPWAARRARTVLGHHRLRRAAHPHAAARSHTVAHFHAAGSAEAEERESVRLAAVAERLVRARVRLVSAALRHAGSENWTVARLRPALRTDPVVRRLADADQLLCQAVDCIERHLDDLRKDTA